MKVSIEAARLFEASHHYMLLDTGRVDRVRALAHSVLIQADLQ